MRADAGLGASERALGVYKLGRWLGEWEKSYAAAALYLVDPRAEEEVLRDMAELAYTAQNDLAEGQISSWIALGCKHEDRLR